VALALGGRSLWIAVFGVSLRDVPEQFGRREGRTSRATMMETARNSKVLKKMP
jgi:hypothetical protein